MNAQRIDCGLCWPGWVCTLAEQANGYYWIALGGAVVLFLLTR